MNRIDGQMSRIYAGHEKATERSGEGTLSRRPAFQDK
jgi:hypothetical protein